MPALLLLIIAALMLTSGSSPALAEELPEINLARGILVYKGFQHSLALSYDYSANKTDQDASSSVSISHALKESYNATLNLALFDSRILDASMQGSILFDQKRSGSESSTSDKSNSFHYNISASGLNRSRIPFTLLTYRNTNTTMNTFTSPTTTDSIGNEFSISFLNDKLQSSFRYSRDSSDSKVDGSRGKSLANSYSYNAEHRYGTLSNTFLTLSFSDHSGGSSDGTRLSSSTNTLVLNNSLLFGAERQFSLSSQFQVNNASTDNLPVRSINFSESFATPLGKALSLNASYTLTNERSSDGTGQVRENTRNQGDINISHKLFESLRTNVSGLAAFNSQVDGTESRYALRGSASYSKKLSGANNLTLGINKGYDLIDRKFKSGTTPVIDEPHLGVRQGNSITLPLSGATLLNIRTITSRNPVFTYVEGVDYTVNYTLGRITILSGGGVRIDMDGNGTDLYFTYTVFRDPQIKYSAESLSLNSDMSMFDAMMNIGASWSKSGNTVIRGPEANSLQDTTALSAYMNGSYDAYRATLTYQNNATGNLSSQSFSGSISTSWQTDNATIALTAHESYNIYGSTSKTPAYRDNNVDMSISYQRYILSLARLVLQGNANDSRSDLQPPRNSLALRAYCQFSLNMISVNLTAQNSWNFTSTSTSRSDSFHIDLSRDF